MSFDILKELRISDYELRKLQNRNLEFIIRNCYLQSWIKNKPRRLMLG